MEQGTKGGGRLSGAGKKGRGEVEWSREQREGEVAQGTKGGGRLSGAGNKGRGEVEWSREQREGGG